MRKLAYITRTHHRGHGQWAVRFRVLRPARMVAKSFADSAHGGAVGALKKAVRWRDLARRKFRKRVLAFRPAFRLKAQRGNRTKVVGVHRFYKRVRGHKVLVFAAKFKNARGNWTNRPFYVGRNYTEAEAFREAVRVRRAWEKSVS